MYRDRNRQRGPIVDHIAEPIAVLSTIIDGEFHIVILYFEASRIMALLDSKQIPYSISQSVAVSETARIIREDEWLKRYGLYL